MRASGTAAEAVRRVRCVPDRYRVFDQSGSAATRVHRVGPDLLDELVGLGLPCRDVAGERWFNGLDLENVGLLLGLPTPRSRAMRYWSRSLLRDDAGATTAHPLVLSARCPDPGHRGACRFELDPAVAAAVVPGSLSTPLPGVYHFEVAGSHSETFFGPRFAELIDQVAGMDFHVLPQALYDDVGFALRTGIASCNLASRVAVVLAGDLGLPVRAVYGYFLTAPYLMWHHWCEFRCGNRWLAADPFLLSAMARWGLPGSERWPAHRSPGALLWRVGVQDVTTGSRRLNAVTHAGTAAPFTVAPRERAR